MDSRIARDPESGHGERDAMLAFVNSCQVLAGSVPFLGLTESVAMVSRLRRALPKPRTAATRSVLASLVIELVLRLHETYTVQPPIRSMALARVAAARGNADQQRIGDLLLALEAELRQMAASDAPRLSLSASSAPLVSRALSVIQHCYTRPDLRLSMVARRLGRSESRCEHLLKEHTGFTFGQHVHRLRIAHAKRLLADGEMSIKEISGTVGYGAASSLDRYFKTVTGMSPGAWRRHYDRGAATDNE